MNKNQIEDFVDGFVAFIGEGENNRGTFPMNLSELNDDMQEFIDKYEFEKRELNQQLSKE